MLGEKDFYTKGRKRQNFRGRQNTVLHQTDHIISQGRMRQRKGTACTRTYKGINV